MLNYVGKIGVKILKSFICYEKVLEKLWRDNK